MERPARAAFVGAIVAALITLPALGAGTLWDNSETAYGEVAREVLLSHDWVVMHLNAAPWYVQPPLYFWIGALFIKAFGLTSFALRLPSALATIVMGAMTGYAVARQAGTRIGIYASVILSSSLMQAIIGRLAIMDALLDVAVALTVFWWFRALEAGRDRYFIYGWIAAGFGFLAKGPVAPVVALIVIVPFVLWNSRVERVRLPSLRGWILALGAFVLVMAPWLVALAMRSGPSALVEMIGHYTVGRYTGVIENQAGPFWYYLPVVILGFFPWIAFLPGAVVHGARALRDPQTPQNIARLWRLAFTWVVLPFVFFSFARTKLPNYIALEVPALALIVALYIDDAVQNARSRWIAISAASVPVFIGAVAFAISVFVHDNKLAAGALSLVPDLEVTGLAIFVGSVVTAVLFVRKNTMSIAPYALAISVLLSIDILIGSALGKTDQFKPIPEFAKMIESGRHPGDAVAIQSFRGANALVFYTLPHVYSLAPAGAEASDEGVSARSVLCGNARIWLVAPKGRPAFDPTYGRRRVLLLENGSGALFLVDGPACRP
jgi:4-amino-4-deoxy-L-arabinose transferase